MTVDAVRVLDRELAVAPRAVPRNRGGSAEPGVQCVHVVDLHVQAHARGRDVLLTVAQHDQLDDPGRRREQRALVVGPAVPAADLLEPERVAVERDRRVVVARTPHGAKLATARS